MRHNLNRGLDQKLGPCEAIFFELRQNLADVMAAQMGDEGIPIGQTVGSDTLGNAGSEDLLGAGRPTPRRNSTVSRSTKGRGRASISRSMSLILLYQRGLAGTGVLHHVIAHQRKMQLSLKIDKFHYPCIMIG